jgi:hypothetical protein
MSYIKQLEGIVHNFTQGSVPFTDSDGQLTENNSLFNWSTSVLTAGTFVFNIDQVVGSGQDRFPLMYVDSGGEIELTQLIVSDISGLTATVAELNLLDFSVQNPLEGRILISDGVGGGSWDVLNLSDTNNDVGFVTITGLTNNYVPYWNNGSGTFEDSELQRDSQYNLKLDGANANEFIRLDSEDGGITISTDNNPILSFLNYNGGFSTLENSWDITLDSTGKLIIQPAVTQPSGATDTFVIQTSNDADRLILNVETGAFQLSQYGSQTFVGTAAYWLATDANGNIIEMDAPSGGGGSSPLTTKGDIYVYSSGDTRLPVGSDGQIVVADSNEPSGLKWETITGSTISAGFFYESTGGVNLPSGSFATVPINVQDLLVGNIITFSGNEYTFNEAGNYLIIYHVSGALTSGSRGGLNAKLQIDTGSGFNDITGTLSYADANSAQVFCTCSASVVLDVSTGDTIKLVAGGVSQTFDTVANASGISFIKLDTIGLGSGNNSGGGGGDETDTLSKNIRTVTNNTNILAISDYTILADATSNTIDITLPDAATTENQIFVIKAINITNNVTVDTSGGNIDGSSTYTFSQTNESITVQSNGTNYYII